MLHRAAKTAVNLYSPSLLLVVLIILLFALRTGGDTAPTEEVTLLLEIGRWIAS
jgi:hypothetical protein